MSRNKEVHAARMAERKARRAREYAEWKSVTPPPYITANISVNHPDYGLSPKQHEDNKLANLQNR